MSYKRVLPRDLFNEAKLLKCIGKISLLIHDNKIKGLNLSYENNEEFKILQNVSDGSLYIDNIDFSDNQGDRVEFSCGLNARNNWPLEMFYQGEYYLPLNEKGEYQLDDHLFLGGES